MLDLTKPVQTRAELRLIDADELEIAQRHARRLADEIAVAVATADEPDTRLHADAQADALDHVRAIAVAFGYRLQPITATRADAYAVDALESLATALGYRLVPYSARGALADSVNLLSAVRDRETV